MMNRSHDIIQIKQILQMHGICHCTVIRLCFHPHINGESPPVVSLQFPAVRHISAKTHLYGLCGQAGRFFIGIQKGVTDWRHVFGNAHP